MKRYRGYQFKQAVNELTHKIAKEFGVSFASIEWDDAVPTAGISKHGRIYFCDVADDAILYDIDVQRYVGFAVHELLHRKYTDFDVKDGNDYIDQLHNACEDAWIEHTGIDANLTGNIGGLLTALLDQMVGEANATVQDWTDPRQYPFIFAVYLRRHLNCHVPVPEGIEHIIHEASARINDCQSSHDTLRLAKWINDQLQALPQNPNQSNSKPSQGSGNGRLSDNPFKNTGKARAPQQGGGAVQVEPTNKAPDGKAGRGSWSEDASVIDMGRHMKADAWMTDKANVPARLRYEVKRLFDNSGMEDFQRNRRSGAINVNALHKVGLTDKVFQRRHSVEGIDSAVVVCIDVSGSMFDEGASNEKYGHSDRIVQAIMTAQALIDTLQKAQVATCVLTFGYGSAVIKGFNEHPTKAQARLGALKDGGGTNDYFAVRYAHKLLLNRPEQRKIAFVITDGQGHPYWVKEQCLIGERLGVTTIGIGISTSVSNVYPQSVMVRNASELGTVSFKQIKLAV
jgi:hypothetical protein